tara:strand:+ start:963 stop:1454 length:492 start_codon:yes stop_codon:yes gene_type:complete
MSPEAVLADPQKFIDYLSKSEKLLWHFKNDPIWGWDCETPPEWGWCGAVQANFYSTLYHDSIYVLPKSPGFNHDDMRKLTFYLADGGCHVVTWYNKVIIDTMFNSLICGGKRYKLTESPIKEAEQEDIDYYYKNSPVRLVFAKQITLKNTGNINGQFPPFLSC